MKSLWVLFLLVMAAATYAQRTPPAAASDSQPLRNPIVYTSQPIDTTPWETFGTMSVHQPATEVARITQGFGESDLEIKRVDGTVETIFNCTTSQVVCAAQEPRSNPAGDTVAFSVSFGNAVEPNGLTVNEWLYAKIYLYEMATGKLYEIPNQDMTTHNRMPDWLNNKTLVYASNKGVWDETSGHYQPVFPPKDQWNCHAGTYPDGRKRGYNNGECVSQAFGSGQASRSMQIWKMHIDGSNQVNLTPHEYNAIRPIVLRHPQNKGRIVYSAWWSNEDLSFYQSAPGPGTSTNLWRLVTMDGNGADNRVFWGAHHSGYLNKQAPQGFQQVVEVLAIRAFMDDRRGRICGVSYYRGNHGGLGDTFCASQPDPTVEGCSTQACYQRSFDPMNNSPGSGQFIPPDMTMIAPFGVGSDNEQNIDAQGRAVGKFGSPFLLSTGRIAGTWGKGWCYNQLSDRGFKPLSCDKNIAELLVDQVTDPFNPAQLKVLVGDPNKHEMDAVEVYPHRIPPQTPPLDPSKGCFLQVVDMRRSELVPRDATFHWSQRAELVGIQANTVNPFVPATYTNRIKGLTLLGVKNWSVDSRDPRFYAQIDYMGYEDVWFLGTQPMMEDGSLKAQVPCEQPLLMTGTDAQGRAIAHDPMLHSLRRGETRTCRGCHEGHSTERAAGYTESAVAMFAKTLAASSNPPLLNGAERVTFAEVGPIITKACSGCHTGFQNDSLLWSRVFADQEQLDFPWMKKMHNINGTQLLPRPYFSGLAARYADWSMLVWVMQGKRSDGFDNSDYADDQDYPTGHPPVPVTPAEISKVEQYIQLGTPKG